MSRSFLKNLLRSLLIIFLLLLCLFPFLSKKEEPIEIKKENKTRSTSTSQKTFYSLLDQLPLATFVSDKPLSEWFSNIKTPYKMLNPRSQLTNEAAFLSVKVALLQPNVEAYPNSNQENSCPKAQTYDPVWNRHRGIYQSKDALFLPPKTIVNIPLPSFNESVTLQFSAAAALQKMLPPTATGGNLTFFVSDGTNEIASYTLNLSDCSIWTPLSVTIPPHTKQLTLGTRFSDVIQTEEIPQDTDWAVFIGNPTILRQVIPTNKPKNLLWIVVDTLRKDASNAMPYLTQYATNNISFERAFSNATWTRPSITSMFLGKLPSAQSIGAKRIVLSSNERALFYRQNESFLPLIAKENGYITKAIGNNFFLLGYPQIGLDLGFSEVDDIRHPVLDTNAITKGVLDFLSHPQQNNPFFLYVHYDAPHFPYTPPKHCKKRASAFLKEHPSFFAESVQHDKQFENYLGEYFCIDEELEKIIEALHQNPDLNENTTVVITGDHGEIFDINHNHFVVDQKQPTLYHHGWSAYDEVLHVPLVIHTSQNTPKRVEHPVQLMDLFPTLIKHLNLRTQNLANKNNLLDFDVKNTSDPIISEGQNITAIRNESYLYLRRENGQIKSSSKDSKIIDRPEELYDLKKDPPQHNNLTNSPNQPLDILEKFRSIFSNLHSFSPQQEPIISLQLSTTSTNPASFILSPTPKWSVYHKNDLVHIEDKKEGTLVTFFPGGLLEVKASATSLDLVIKEQAPQHVSLRVGKYALFIPDFFTAPSTWTLPAFELAMQGKPPIEISQKPNTLFAWASGFLPTMKLVNTSLDPKLSPEVKTIMKEWGYMPQK